MGAPTTRPSISAEILHEALRQASGFVIITDADMTIVYVNRLTMGYRAEDVIGSRHGSHVSPEQRRKLEHAAARARTTGRAQHYETFLDAPDGQRYFYSNQISAYETADGHRGMISILTNVTRQRHAEARIEGLRRELLQASHRAGMAEVATGVLHSVGNVLNSINVSAEALAQQLDGSRLHLLGRAMAMLDDGGDRLAQLLEHDPRGRKLPTLLRALHQQLELERDRMQAELARLHKHLGLVRSIIEAQQDLARTVATPVPVRPDQLVRRVLTMFELELESGDVHVELALDDAGTVMLDELATLQVLANLIRNALDALDVVDRRRTLAIRLRADEHQLHFHVEDDGCGIEQEHLQRLFQYGFTTKPRGHGFGLHASAIAVRTMNGTLQIHSDGPGRGTRVHVVLPKILPVSTA